MSRRFCRGSAPDPERRCGSITISTARTKRWCDAIGAAMRGPGPRVVESCTGEDASFENRYVLRGGRIAVAVQWVSPQLGSYRLEDLG